MAATVFCAFNTQQFPFNNENIRKAFSHAIDRDFIVSQVTQLGEIPAARLIPPVLYLGFCRFEYNKERARGYLEIGLRQLGVIKENENRLDTDNLRVRLFFDHLTLCYSGNGVDHGDDGLEIKWGE